MPFRYFGSKNAQIGTYPPPPKGMRIIEPFCGSAGYARRYFYRDVIISDPYPAISSIWLWIQQASRRDIVSLPMLPLGSSVTNCKQLSIPEKLLLGFANKMGAPQPADKVTRMSRVAIPAMKKKLLALCGKIDHWVIMSKGYKEIPNQRAMWFIDPPYQLKGSRYVRSSDGINYDQLAEWCKSRYGVCVVCEASGADWLPFEEAYKLRTQGGADTIEMVWRHDRDGGSENVPMPKGRRVATQENCGWTFPSDEWRAPKGTSTRAINQVFITEPHVWHTKEEVLRATEAPIRLVNARLSNLVRYGWVEKKGKKYRKIEKDKYRPSDRTDGVEPMG